MARYALVDTNDQIIREVDEKRLDPDAGVRDGFRWIIVVNEVVDLTTPGNSDIKSSSAEYVEPTQVRRVRTIVDKTNAEVNAEIDAVVDQWDNATRDQLYALAIYVRDLTGLVFDLTNIVRTNNGDAEINLATFGNAMDAAKSKVPMSVFKNRVKGNLS